MLPSVSVVIPTVGRPQVFRAIQSVREQTYSGPVEVVVSVDNAHAMPDETRSRLMTASDAFVASETQRRGGAARNAGVRRAQGDYVAYLDDDDEWTPTKVERQISAALDVADTHVQSCRFRYSGGSKEALGIPQVLAQPSQEIQDYLFRRRQPSARRQSVHTSTILHLRTLALDSPWQEDLVRHQDWDYLLRLQARHDVRVHQLPDVLVSVQAGSASSISATADWRASLEFAMMWRSTWDSSTFADFVAAQPLRYALQGRDKDGVVACLQAVRESRAMPSLGPTLIGLSGVVRRSVIEGIIAR